MFLRLVTLGEGTGGVGMQLFLFYIAATTGSDLFAGALRQRCYSMVTGMVYEGSGV